MIIVGDNLKSLITQHNIVDDLASGFDNTSIGLTLDSLIIKIIPNDESVILTYGTEIPEEWIQEQVININDGVVLEPKQSVLACSYETVKIPIGYFGLLQTKGSLARLFVSLHCNDSQIEPGFKGKITFEICNLSNMRIRLLPRQKVGDLFIIKASTKHVNSYNGRYQNATKPTIQLP
ncbi:dCTP deaminase [Fibrella aestuarina]|uniref:dCTP deaminase n=1 Tax=Fibrella aestuarina TaxID=651143 RepID=UPI00059C9136